MKLEHHYPGDEEWLVFVNAHKKYVHLDDKLLDLTELLNGNKEVSIVILSLLGRIRSFEWIYKRPNILDGYSPIECLNEVSLTRRLKTSLMRWPV